MVDMFLKDGSLKMMLTMSLYGTWRPEYYMTLTPLNIYRVDILEALLRDAQEEIVSLKTEVARLKAYSAGPSTYVSKRAFEELKTEFDAMKANQRQTSESKLQDAFGQK
jgi:FtsZ-binding cell division protein ZapB